MPCERATRRLQKSLTRPTSSDRAKEYVHTAFFIFIVASSTTLLAQLPDPGTLLQRAAAACKRVETVTYDVDHYVIGLLHYGKITATLNAIAGTVHLHRAADPKVIRKRSDVDYPLLTEADAIAEK